MDIKVIVRNILRHSKDIFFFHLPSFPNCFMPRAKDIYMYINIGLHLRYLYLLSSTPPIKVSLLELKKLACY